MVTYLLCLTDNPQGELTHASGHSHRFIPVLGMADVPYAKELASDIGSERSIAVDGFNKSQNSACLFALVVEDNSMQPVFDAGDLVIW